MSRIYFARSTKICKTVILTISVLVNLLGSSSKVGVNDLLALLKLCLPPSGQNYLQYFAEDMLKICFGITVLGEKC